MSIFDPDASRFPGSDPPDTPGEEQSGDLPSPRADSAPLSPQPLAGLYTIQWISIPHTAEKDKNGETKNGSSRKHGWDDGLLRTLQHGPGGHSDLSREGVRVALRIPEVPARRVSLFPSAWRGARRHPSRPGARDPGKHELRPRGGSGRRLAQDRASRRGDRPAAGRHPRDGEFLLVPHPRRTELGGVAGRTGVAGGT